MSAKTGISADRLPPGDIDRLHDVEDFTEKSLRALIRRIERSRTPEHMVYREAELDEVWRLVDGALRELRAGGGSEDAAAIMERLRAIVMRAHDFVGVDSDVAKAATELRGGIFLALSCVNLMRR
jgi:hypothetical protein